MHYQRAHQQRTAPLNRHNQLAGRVAELGLGIGTQASESVRSGHDAERPIFGGAGVDMDSDRDEAFKNRRGWLYEEDPLLARPAAALGILNTLTDRDTEVLV